MMRYDYFFNAAGTEIARKMTTDIETGTGKMIGRLGLACIVAALVAGVVNGIWEITSPSFSDPETFASAPRAKLYGHAFLEVLKTAGFLAGIYGFYFAATKRGFVTKAFLTLGVLGGLFYVSMHFWIAATGHFSIVYVLGGMWYQMIAPVALGVASLFARRVPWWICVWAIAVGLINSQIFVLVGPGYALIVQGLIWLVFGLLVYGLRRRDYA
jgi:hypothetical protein